MLPTAPAPGQPALRASELLAPDLRCETPRVRRVQDAGVAAVADGDLADVHVDTGHGPVVRALDGGDGVTDDRHPFAVDAFQDGLDGLSVRVRVAAAPAQPEPAQLREVQLVVPDADVLRDHHAVAVAALEPRASGLAPEEPPPRVGLVLQRVPHRGARHGLQPGRRPAQLRERLAQREERRARAAMRAGDQLRLLVQHLVPDAPAGAGNRRQAPGCRRTVEQHPVDDLAMVHVVGRTRRRCPGGSVEPDGRRRLLHARSCSTEQ